MPYIKNVEHEKVVRRCQKGQLSRPRHFFDDCMALGNEFAIIYFFSSK